VWKAHSNVTTSTTAIRIQLVQIHGFAPNMQKARKPSVRLVQRRISPITVIPPPQSTLSAPKPATAAAKIAPPSLAIPRGKAPLYLGGATLYLLAVYGAYVYISTSNSISAEPVKAKALDEQEDISHVYNTIAKKYDSGIWTSELLMGLPLLRRSMTKRAKVSTCPPAHVNLVLNYSM
jgi:hypothetical protein